MNIFALRVAALLAAVTLGAVAVTSARPLSLGQKAKLDGIITGRSGDTMTVKTDQGSVVAVLTANTDVSARKGRLGLIRKEAAATALIPGLKVGIEGVGDDKGQLHPTKVRFLSGDLETARAIEAGLAETEDKVAANQQGIEANRHAIGGLQDEQARLGQRMGQLGDYDITLEAVVYFEVGSAAISEQGARDLAGNRGQGQGSPGLHDRSGGIRRRHGRGIDQPEAQPGPQPGRRELAGPERRRPVLPHARAGGHEHGQAGGIEQDRPRAAPRTAAWW